MSYPQECTPHYKRVREFMERAEQEVPKTPTVPDPETRILRARLIFEEAMETIHALGVSVGTPYWNAEDGCDDYVEVGQGEELKFLTDKPTEMVGLDEIIDGCCDVAVVTTGTLIACGVPDAHFQELVDENNLAKFGPGGHRDEHGKWIKPPDHKPPAIAQMLADLNNRKVEPEREAIPGVPQLATHYSEYTHKNKPTERVFYRMARDGVWEVFIPSQSLQSDDGWIESAYAALEIEKGVDFASTLHRVEKLRKDNQQT